MLELTFTLIILLGLWYIRVEIWFRASMELLDAIHAYNMIAIETRTPLKPYPQTTDKEQFLSLLDLTKWTAEGFYPQYKDIL